VASVLSIPQELVLGSARTSVAGTPQGPIQDPNPALISGYSWILVPGLPAAENASLLSLHPPPPPTNSPRLSVDESAGPSARLPFDTSTSIFCTLLPFPTVGWDTSGAP
jgi:hypothetical protein